MPEQSFENPNVEKVLENLEDHTITTYQSRCWNYQSMQSALDNQHDVSEKVVLRILAVCLKDLKEDMKYAVHNLNVISVIVKKVKDEWSFNLNLTTTIMAILNLLKSAILINKVQNLQNLCFEVLMTFPNETFRELGSEPKYSLEIINIFNLYFNQNVPIQVRLLPFDILYKLLQALPPDKRANFVKENINTWFSKVIPTVMTMVTSANPMVPKMIDVVEMLTDELVEIEYSQNGPWLNILDSLSSQSNYTYVLKTLLDSGSPMWSRLWIVFVKLAKQQITAIRLQNGSPINNMLPVVENAFKIDTGNRLRAFHCWDVLIDNFAAESTDSVKRVKLLVIPLKSNNAKVEETAVAKFHTWWNLIRKFYSRSDKMFESIVLPFFHFCFGNVNSTSEKNASAPGLCYPVLTVKCAQAFAEICGHINCQGCVTETLAPLQKGMLSSIHLKKHFSEWLFTLKVFLKVMGLQSCKYEKKKEHIQCVWSSFVLVSADLPQDRKSSMIGELLNILRELVQENKDDGLTETVFSLCLSSLIEHQHVRRGLTTKMTDGGETSHLHKVLRLTLHPQVQMLYNRFDDETMDQLKPITNIITDNSFGSPDPIIEWLLMELTPSDASLVFWTALLKAVLNINNVSEENLMGIFLWPLKHLGEFNNTQYASNVWSESYNKLKPKFSEGHLQKEISVILLTDRRSTIDHFSLYALLHTLKDVLNASNDCKLEAELLVNLLSKAKYPGHIDVGLPLITDCLELMIAKAAESKSEAYAEYAVNATRTTLKFLFESCKEGDAQENKIALIERIIKSIEFFFKLDAFIHFKTLLVDQLIELLNIKDITKNLKGLILDILKGFLKKSKSSEMPFYSIVNDAIISMEDVGNKNEQKAVKSDTGFTTPSSKIVTKKNKKKEANIVETVVDNGEQYEVIKSHWKFNPRKLTEKQKERLQRKREDIPALYQDLSQSQDEFKLTTWKTDSQDTSTSNSKSECATHAADITSALQKMASSDVVPEIMKNILSTSANPASVQVVMPVTPKHNAGMPVTPKPKNSPRIALKDRVKHLIERISSPNCKEPKEMNHTITDTDLIKTPKTRVESPKTAFSEPSKPDCQRPARVKRKPKKYDLNFVKIPLKRKHCDKNLSSDSQNEENLMIVENRDVPNNNDTAIALEQKTNDTKSTPLKTKFPANEHQAENILNENITNFIMNSKPQIDSRDVIIVEDNEESQKGVPDNLMETDSQVIPETIDTQDVEVPVQVKSSPDKNFESAPNPSTPSNSQLAKQAIKTSTKKSGHKSRIVNALVIDTVEGNPFFKSSEGRPKRKAVSRRRNLSQETSSDKIESKLQVQTPKKAMSDEPKTKHSDIELKQLSESVSNEYMILSEDFIESSQDSTLTTISVRSTKSSTKKAAKSARREEIVPPRDNSQSLLDDTVDRFSRAKNDSKEDIEFSRNKSINLTVEIKDTPDLDTEPIDKSNLYSDVIIINDDPEPIIVNTANDSVSPESQEIANADTQPVNPNNLQNENGPTELDDVAETQLEITDIETALDTTAPNKSEQSSPFKDQDQRNKDFLNDTLEISPIKTMSPVKDDDTIDDIGEDYEIILLNSPVQTNGEPFEKSSSPEIFTEDKMSPDKRDLTPPRDDVVTTTPTASPNTSLSLKKNRPQMRTGNRAAQMLGLCAPDRLQTILNNCDRADEEIKPSKTSGVTTPARRNLRIQYLTNENNENNEAGEGSDESENCENFLMFKKVLPSANSSPSGPILKRKLAEITDESTMSPASKRKRVSFHDPPVSTTVAVQKYIEPLGVRSPQNISKKITRQKPNNMKSPKKLENMFKLDTVLTRAVESFTDITTASDDTEISSLEPTLTIEVIRNEELNNTDPICPELISCQDSIAVLASELSSPAMKTLFVKELVGKIETVGDLAKLTELEVNRLCIRAPKVVIARKVLNEYADKKCNESQEIGHIEQVVSADVHCSAFEKSDMEIQTESVAYNDVEMQTNEVSLASVDTQTEAASVASSLVQTDESGSKSTKDIIKSCLEERNNFIEELNLCLNEAEKTTIAKDLSFTQLAHLLSSKLKTDFSSKSLGLKDVILLCSDMLKNIHDNAT